MYRSTLVENRPLVTKILEAASGNYGDDSALEDPIIQLGYDPHEVRRAVEYCRQEGLLGERAQFGRESREVRKENWWTGGLTIQGMEELENRNRSLRVYKRDILRTKDRYNLG